MPFRLPVVLGLLAAAAAAQEPSIHVTFAADQHLAGPPALTWLRRECLPGMPGWPAGLDPRAAFAVALTRSGMVVRADAGPPGEDYLAGEFVLPGVGPVLLACDRDGVEDWFGPRDGELPARLGQLVAALQPGRGPGTVDVAAVLGNLRIGLEADPAQAPLSLCATECGELTWLTWASGERLRVRGRSGGGLLLPAFVLWLGTVRDRADTGTWWSPMPEVALRSLRLRAFAARDGARAEAARQVRLHEPDGAVLRALLHGDDATRAAAMDGLVRQRDPASLPGIVAAADPALPASVAMAECALAELWPLAPPAVRADVVTLLGRSACDGLRAIDLAALQAPRGAPSRAAFRVQWGVLWSFLLLECLLYALYLRERRQPPPTAFA